MLREIPAGSTLVQEGLYMYVYTKTIGNNTYTFGELYAEDGYQFWWNTNPENYDEEGKLLPLEQRTFAQWTSLGLNPTVDAVNAEYFSVPVQSITE